MESMKKFIFGCVLMLCGTIGFSGWAIACTNYASGYTRTVTYLYQHMSDRIYTLLFIGIFLCGLVLTLKELKKDSGSAPRKPKKDEKPPEA